MEAPVETTGEYPFSFWIPDGSEETEVVTSDSTHTNFVNPHIAVFRWLPDDDGFVN